MEKIKIKDLLLRVKIGITKKENKRRQKILVTVEIEPNIDHREINDNIRNTIDYSKIRIGTKRLVENRSFNLIETVAYYIAKYIKDNYNCKSITVEVKKFPYRDAKFVSYKLTV